MCVKLSQLAPITFQEHYLDENDLAIIKNCATLAVWVLNRLFDCNFKIICVIWNAHYFTILTIPLVFVSVL